MKNNKSTWFNHRVSTRHLRLCASLLWY